MSLVFLLLLCIIEKYEAVVIKKESWHRKTPWTSPDLGKVALPEQHMNVSELIVYNGYPCEDHTVTTEDGYILSLQRIPFGRNKQTKKKGVVLLQHGLLDSAATWVVNLPAESLGFILADNGYDVWLPNSRGNTYSNSHVNFTTKDAAFWDFSFDEMAKYDLPAVIDYVLHVSESNQLHYVGHSQGTMIAFIEFSRNIELSKKIKTFVALAPVAEVGHIKGLLKVLSYAAPETEFLFKVLGIRDFIPNGWLFQVAADLLCDHKLLDYLCELPMLLIAGWDISNLNRTRTSVYITHTPAGTSVKNVVHFVQLIQSKTFRRYDYGKCGNIKHYNQPTPPNYNITELSVPTAFFTATNDWLADPQDIDQYLLPRLNHTLIYSKSIEAWNHLDFVWGVDANKVVYNDIVMILNKHSRDIS